jgi:hypothetical protein
MEPISEYPSSERISCISFVSGTHGILLLGTEEGIVREWQFNSRRPVVRLSVSCHVSSIAGTTLPGGLLTAISCRNNSIILDAPARRKVWQTNWPALIAGIVGDTVLFIDEDSRIDWRTL